MHVKDKFSQTEEFKIVARKFPSLCPFHAPLFFPTSITKDFQQEASMKRNVVDTSLSEGNLYITSYANWRSIIFNKLSCSHRHLERLLRHELPAQSAVASAVQLLRNQCLFGASRRSQLDKNGLYDLLPNIQMS